MPKFPAWLLLPCACTAIAACSSSGPSDDPSSAPTTAGQATSPVISGDSGAPGTGVARRVSSDPGAVAKEFLRLRLSWDTATDQSKADAQRRSTSLATGQLAQPDPVPVKGDDAQWRSVAASRGRLKVELDQAFEDQRPDTAQDAERTYVVTSTPIDAAGRPLEQSSTSIYRIRLQMTPAGWRVSRLIGS